MKNQLSVRSLLVDPITKKYIKAVNEQDFSDFIQLLAKPKGDSRFEVFDFSPVIEAIHRQIDESSKHRVDVEVSVKRNNVFNGWKRMRRLTNQALLNTSAVNICSEAEDALNWMHTRLPKLKAEFTCAKPGYDSWKRTDEKRTALSLLSGELEAFIEVLLCSIHSMLLVDPGYFKEEDVYIEHCHTARALLIEAMCWELGYRRGEFDWDSCIYQFVMEPKKHDINPNVLLLQLGSEDRTEEIERKVLNFYKVGDFNDGTRGYVVKWPIAPSHKVDAIKVLSRLLQEIDSIVHFLSKLSSNDFRYDANGDEQKNLEREIKLILGKR